MKKVLSYLTDYRKECVFAPLFKMLEASFELFVPLVMAAVIDQGIGAGDKHYVVQMCLVLIALGVVGLTCSVTAQFFAAKAAVGFSTGLRHALFSHIQSLSFTEMDTIGTSTLITRMTSDVNQAQNGVNMFLRLFLRSPFIVFGAMIMAFTIDIKAALIFAITIPLLALVVFGVMKITMPLYKKVQEKLDTVLGITRENLTGARVVRAFNKEQAEAENFSVHNEALTEAQLFVGKISALMNPATYIIINVATVVLLYTGAIRVDTGYITQGEVVALVNYMSQILVELIKLANLIVTLTKASACANRIELVLSMTSSMEFPMESKEREDEAGCLVEFDHVGLKYAGAGAEALSDISFQAKKGQVIGIIGGTGSGKSSLINLIPRFYDATSGNVFVDGKNVKAYTKEEIRDKVGMVMQKAVLFQGTIRDNLKWGKQDATEEELAEALLVSQSKEFVDQKAGRLDARIEQGGKNLSGGQKQRLTIARALMKNPEILILDDSASALDFATDAALRKAIRERKEKATVFIVTQRASSILHADQIIVLDDGAVAGIGTHEKLMEDCEVYQEIYYSQFEKEEKRDAKGKN